MRGTAHFRLMNFLMVNLDRTVVMRVTVPCLKIFPAFLNRLCLERGVLRPTVNARGGHVRFDCNEVSCVVAHFQMIF